MPRKSGIELLIRSGLCLIFFFTMAACTFRPTILSATVHETSADDATVHVRLSHEDASVIKRRQLYFGIVTVDCGSMANGYPIEPFIAGQTASEFEFPVAPEGVEVTGSIPIGILREFRRPCVFLQGGGYFMGKIESPPISLQGARTDVLK